MIYYARLRDGERRVEIRKEGSTYFCDIDGQEFVADARLIDGPNVMSLIVDRKCYEAVITTAGSKMTVSTGGEQFEIELADELEHRGVGQAGASADLGIEEVKAPMPGVVVALEVETGQRIVPGSPVVIVEAMKMQNEISTLGGGMVKKILVKAGDVVESQQTLVIVDST
jgi:biotin carboxyl carrier protein